MCTACASQVDAIMVGVDTIITDDPQLTARAGREGGQLEKQPLRIVVDSNGRTPPSARVLRCPGRPSLHDQGTDPGREHGPQGGRGGDTGVAFAG